MNSYERPDGATMVQIVGRPYEFVNRDFGKVPLPSVPSLPEERFNAPPLNEKTAPVERSNEVTRAVNGTVNAETTPLWNEPATAVTKRRGRPVGSKNKPKVAAAAVDEPMWPFDKKLPVKRTSKAVLTH